MADFWGWDVQKYAENKPPFRFGMNFYVLYCENLGFFNKIFMFYTAKIWDFLIKILRKFYALLHFYFSSRKYTWFFTENPPDAVDSPGSHTRIAILLAIYLLYIFRPLIATEKNCPQQRAIKINLFFIKKHRQMPVIFIACLRPCFVPVFAVLRTFWQNQPAA